MVQREKILAGAMAGAIGLFGAFQLIQTQIVAPRATQIETLQRERLRQSRLENILAGAPATLERWHALTRRTLSASPDEAHKLFYKHVAELIAASGLREATNAKVISQGQPLRFKERTRRGFVELPLSVAVEGELPQVVEFLRRVYELPYLVRVGSLNISRDASEPPGGERRNRRSGRSETRLNVTMKLSTLVLPRLPNVEHPTYDPALPPDSQPAELPPLARRDPDAYEEIARRNLFQLYVEPVREVVRSEPAHNDKPPPQAPPPPPPDPRRGTDNLYLTATVSLDGEPIAYVIDQSRREEEPRKYRLNDPIDDGRLVLIHPTGIVVESPNPPPGEPAADENRPDQRYLYFYPFRKSFRERELLRPDENTEIARLVRAVLDLP